MYRGASSKKYARLGNLKGKYVHICMYYVRRMMKEKKKIRVRERITGSRLHIRLFSRAEQMQFDNSIFNFYRGSKLNELEYLSHARFSFRFKSLIQTNFGNKYGREDSGRLRMQERLGKSTRRDAIDVVDNQSTATI